MPTEPHPGLVPTPVRAFETAYEGVPSWEIGRPQRVVVRLLERAAITGRVLDAGCGTGTHAVLLAAAGHDVTGIDVAARAVELARAKAADAGVLAAFIVGDILAADPRAVPGAPFDTALDVGLFHVLQPADRGAYARALAALVRPGGTMLLVAWSDRNPFGYGPERVTRRAIRTSFSRAAGWRVETIEPEMLVTRLEPGTVHAWLARIRRR